jgi:hypothetical protein
MKRCSTCAEIDRAIADAQAAEREVIARRLDMSYVCYSPSPIADALLGMAKEFRDDSPDPGWLDRVKEQARLRGKLEEHDNCCQFCRITWNNGGYEPCAVYTKISRQLVALEAAAQDRG